MLTVGSLFSGIGGFDLGLERTGRMRTVWFCEQDPYCQRVLAKHWPGVPIHGDVRTLVADTDGERLQAAAIHGQAANGVDHGGDESLPGGRVVPVPVPYVDILTGGFPCQDLSYAGRGAGITGERSGLWTEYARLIRELRPRYVLVENVPALLARGMGRVLGDLAACGYDAEWDCIPASAVGAPHRRDRVWIIAYPQDDGSQDQRFAGGNEAKGTIAGGRGATTGSVADAAWDLPTRATPPRTIRERTRPGREPRNVGDADGSGSQGHRGHDQRPGERTPRPTGTQPRGMGDANGAPADSHTTGDMADPDEIGRGRRPRQPRPGRGDDRWLTEPDVGRVAHGVPARPHGGGVDDPERSRYQEARAAGASHDDAMRAVRELGASEPPSPGLHEGRGDRGRLLDVPPADGRSGRDATDSQGEGLHDLRGDVHELQPLQGEDLLNAMPSGSWPPSGHEAMGWWDVEPPVGRVAHGIPHRVDRLRALGNALVPQIAGYLAHRILEWEQVT